MKWVVYYFRGGIRFQGTEQECQDWIEKQAIPADYWMELE